jgi:hypothetical protein
MIVPPLRIVVLDRVATGGRPDFQSVGFCVLQQGMQSFKLTHGQDQFVGDALHVRAVRIRIRPYCWLFGHGSSHEAAPAAHFTSMSLPMRYRLPSRRLGISPERG